MRLSFSRFLTQYSGHCLSESEEITIGNVIKMKPNSPLCFPVWHGKGQCMRQSRSRGDVSDVRIDPFRENYWGLRERDRHLLRRLAQGYWLGGIVYGTAALSVVSRVPGTHQEPVRLGLGLPCVPCWCGHASYPASGCLAAVRQSPMAGRAAQRVPLASCVPRVHAALHRVPGGECRSQRAAQGMRAVLLGLALSREAFVSCGSESIASGAETWPSARAGDGS